MKYKINKTIAKLIKEDRSFKIIYGPRRSGKTTAAFLRTMFSESPTAVIYMSGYDSEGRIAPKVFDEVKQNLANPNQQVDFFTVKPSKIRNIYIPNSSSYKKVYIILDNFSKDLKNSYFSAINDLISNGNNFRYTPIEVLFILDPEKLTKVSYKEIEYLKNSMSNYAQTLYNVEDFMYRIDFRETKDLTEFDENEADQIIGQCKNYIINDLKKELKEEVEKNLKRFKDEAELLEASKKMMEEAKRLKDLGCFSTKPWKDVCDELIKEKNLNRFDKWSYPVYYGPNTDTFITNYPGVFTVGDSNQVHFGSNITMSGCFPITKNDTTT